MGETLALGFCQLQVVRAGRTTPCGASKSRVTQTEPSSTGSPELKSSLRPTVVVVGSRATVPWVWHPRAPCGVWRLSSGWRLSCCYTSQLAGAVGVDLHVNLRGLAAPQALAAARWLISPPRNGLQRCSGFARPTKKLWFQSA